MSFIRKFWLYLRVIKANFVYARQSVSYMKHERMKDNRVEGESVYKQKWQKLFPWVETKSYRFYSRFCGCIPDIVPEGIGRIIIEEILNPPRFRSYYEDKNAFPVILGNEYLPKPIILRIQGCFRGGDYLPILNRFNIEWLSSRKLVLKPTLDSSSGRDVIIFEKRDKQYVSVTNSDIVLTFDFLKEYGKDFVLQEAIEQHSFMAQFNATSVNTIRLATYRSVVDEKVYVTGGLLRIGGKGSCVDNAHSGGKFVGIDVLSGILGNATYTQFGDETSIWNDIDFSKNKFQIPFWSDVIDLAVDTASKILHCRLLALDIAISKTGKPILIEYNISGFAYWLFEQVGQKPLGEFTDEIIDYCQKRMQE